MIDTEQRSESQDYREALTVARWIRELSVTGLADPVLVSVGRLAIAAVDLAVGVAVKAGPVYGVFEVVANARVFAKAPELQKRLVAGVCEDVVRRIDRALRVLQASLGCLVSQNHRARHLTPRLVPTHVVVIAVARSGVNAPFRIAVEAQPGADVLVHVLRSCCVRR